VASVRRIAILAFISAGALSVLSLLPLHEGSSFGAEIKVATPAIPWSIIVRGGWLPSPSDPNVYTLGVYTGEPKWRRARVRRSGNSQAVRLPKQFRLASKEVEIIRRGDELVLREKKRGLTRVFEILTGLPDDMFVEEREDNPPQRRKGL
jgi:antitoxin VapB